MRRLRAWLDDLMSDRHRVTLVACAMVLVIGAYIAVREAEYSDGLKASAKIAATVSADSAVACSDSALAAQLAAPPVLLPDSTRHVCVYYRTPHISD